MKPVVVISIILFILLCISLCMTNLNDADADVNPSIPNKPFGYKIVSTKNKKMCVPVKEAPNKQNGVYSNELACNDALDKPFGYKIEGKMCVLTKEAPSKQNGVYSNELACNNALVPKSMYNSVIGPVPVPTHLKNYKIVGKTCVPVDEAPNAKNGVYSDYLDCQHVLDHHDPVPVPDKPFGYKIVNANNKKMCVLVNEAPNAKTGVYSDYLDCQHVLDHHDPVPDTHFGYKIEDNKCVLVNEAPNATKGVYSELGCQIALHGGFGPSPNGYNPTPTHPNGYNPVPDTHFGYKIEDNKCVLVNEAPNATKGVYSELGCQIALHGGFGPSPNGYNPTPNPIPTHPELEHTCCKNQYIMFNSN